MKKIMIIGILLGLYGDGMGADHGADYFESRGVQLRKMHLTPELKVIFNLNQGDEGCERQSEDEVISLKAQLIEQKLISDYYCGSAKDSAFYSLCAMVVGGGGCAAKIASYLNAHYVCNDVTKQGGTCFVTCPINPFDWQALLNTPISSFDTCAYNSFAHISFYMSIACVMGVTVYSTYKYVNAPQQSKYKID